MPIRHAVLLWVAGVVMMGWLQAVPAQTCKTKNSLALTPAKQFTSHQNGTVTHLKTGLMWQVCSVGQKWQAGSCKGQAKALTWLAAMQSTQKANQQKLVGFDNWRLPNIKELKSIVEYQCYYPSINLKIFPNTPNGYYWSATPDVDSRYGAYGIGFGRGEGFSDYRDDIYLIRFVRTPQ